MFLQMNIAFLEFTAFSNLVKKNLTNAFNLSIIKLKH